MKVLIVTLLLCIAFCLTHDPLIISQDIIETVNKHPTAGWKAGVNEIFKGKKLSEVRNMFGTVLIDPRTDLREKKFHDVAEDFAPLAFDSRVQWATCIHPIRNQGSCGSCWAFAASSAFSDRMCIKSQGKVNVVMSPQDMVSCDTGDFGCQGGYIDKSWVYIQNKGLVSEACFPYKSGSGAQVACPFNTAPGKCAVATVPYKKYFAVKETPRFFGNIASAMTEIATNGPIETGYRVYQDFFSYKSGVYSHVTGEFAGGHAVKVVGWGKDTTTGQDYWIVANSWGPYWGMQGYFWIKKGTNECGFESSMLAGHADLTRLE